MGDLKIGQILDDTARRDAVHVAVAPVESTSILWPGQHVGLVEGTVDQVASTSPRKIGIIDPYLTAPVYPKQRCYLFLYPNTVTSLRHEWTHPAFVAEADKDNVAPDKDKSKQWLRDFAKSNGMAYQSLIGAIPLCSTYSDMLGGERIDGIESFDIPPEFWDHYEIVSGQKVVQRASSFSCSC